MEQFDALLAQTIDSTLGLRCTMFGYQYSEILRSLFLQNGLRLQDSTYWTYTQAMMHTWWPSNLILGSLKSSWPFAYCLKSHHGVRGFCLFRLHHKDSLRKLFVFERYPQPQISKILQVADFRIYICLTRISLFADKGT